MKTRFFYCKTCGNLVVKVLDSGVTPVCCGEEMTELKVNEIDYVGEKHMPVINAKCNGKVCVDVGESRHPMDRDHWIEFIAIETEKGGQICRLSHHDQPHAEFFIAPGDKLVGAFAYCNIHGLWHARHH